MKKNQKTVRFFKYT